MSAIVKSWSDISCNLSAEIVESFQQWYRPSQFNSSARHLGFIFDSDMAFSDQINSVSKSRHSHIRDIRRICHLLPCSAATVLANSLDHCDSLYSGISRSNLNKPRHIQNSLARVITNTSKYKRITLILKQLYTGFQSNKNRLQALSLAKGLSLSSIHDSGIP